eukprot:3857971-Amphidinium_carterae.1
MKRTLAVVCAASELTTLAIISTCLCVADAYLSTQSVWHLWRVSLATQPAQNCLSATTRALHNLYSFTSGVNQGQNILLLHRHKFSQSNRASVLIESSGHSPCNEIQEAMLYAPDIKCKSAC